MTEKLKVGDFVWICRPPSNMGGRHGDPVDRTAVVTKVGRLYFHVDYKGLRFHLAHSDQAPEDIRQSWDRFQWFRTGDESDRFLAAEKCWPAVREAVARGRAAPGARSRISDETVMAIHELLAADGLIEVES